MMKISNVLKKLNPVNRYMERMAEMLVEEDNLRFDNELWRTNQGLKAENEKLKKEIEELKGGMK